MKSILLIDNLDSFTFNLVEAFHRLGATVRVLRNNVAPGEAFALAGQREALIVLSPGPGAPEDAGCCLDLIRMAKERIPLLGICLGHQAIVLEAGGTVARAPLAVHGKASLLHHDGAGPFAGIGGPVAAGRYHSLCTRDIPPRFRVHAEIDGMAMAITDRNALQTGLQFHPESILTEAGDTMLANILADAAPAGS
ncbi:aminodeoxychorismate/anthranilate synthase component II [Allosphingosinicella flava]|uniref:anthranilate synthase n=1 Tax=Allosphingosinicella flava TaxID=2771430 RepID=A0A7T2LLS7_9SPHN|nr:aminodeoxychorismate/anthranilate synthase component II [Sphingosinicella flava]QPQ54337.1 aminodeoxychorismate/anthranilate synthase component II [Sphingosinicella flava]